MKKGRLGDVFDACVSKQRVESEVTPRCFTSATERGNRTDLDERICDVGLEKQ